MTFPFKLCILVRLSTARADLQIPTSSYRCFIPIPLAVLCKYMVPSRGAELFARLPCKREARDSPQEETGGAGLALGAGG